MIKELKTSPIVLNNDFARSKISLDLNKTVLSEYSGFDEVMPISKIITSKKLYILSIFSIMLLFHFIFLKN